MKNTREQRDNSDHNSQEPFTIAKKDMVIRKHKNNTNESSKKNFSRPFRHSRSVPTWTISQSSGSHVSIKESLPSENYTL